MIIISYILSLVISSLMGIIEGVMMMGFSKGVHVSDVWKEKTGKDIHVLLWVFRAFVFSIGIIFIFIDKGWLISGLYTLSLLLMFSFWHNGMYYYTRSKLDKTYKGFFDQSKDTTAKTSLKPIARSIAFGISLINLYFTLQWT